MTAAVEDFVHAGYDLNAEAILLCESDGTPEEVDEEIGRMQRGAARAAAPPRIAVSQDEAAAPEVLERAARTPSRRVGRISPDYMCMDSHHPAQAPGRHPAGHCRDGEEVRAALRQRVPRRRRQPAPADPVRCQRPRPAAPLRAVRRRHPGDQRAPWAARSPASTAWAWKSSTRMCVQFTPRRARADARREARLRPAGLLNPGKVIPTLQRCAEYGKMHVSKGLLPFPELERF